MKKTRYSKDVDAMLIELSDAPIAFAEEQGKMILHYSANEELVLIEILEVKEFLIESSLSELISTQEFLMT
jgi:nitrate reductase NapAB chaperone NapD